VNFFLEYPTFRALKDDPRYRELRERTREVYGMAGKW
jgi:hypothetical protein